MRDEWWNEDASGDLKGWVEIIPQGGMSLAVSGIQRSRTKRGLRKHYVLYSSFAKVGKKLRAPPPRHHAATQIHLLHNLNTLEI